MPTYFFPQPTAQRQGTSHYALEEARINLPHPVQIERLNALAARIELVHTPLGELPDEIMLPEKDIPIMLAAISARATHLITGDIRHFGAYFGKKVSGILIMPPGDYIREKAERG